MHRRAGAGRGGAAEGVVGSRRIAVEGCTDRLAARVRHARQRRCAVRGDRQAADAAVGVRRAGAPARKHADLAGLRAWRRQRARHRRQATVARQARRTHHAGRSFRRRTRAQLEGRRHHLGRLRRRGVDASGQGRAPQRSARTAPALTQHRRQPHLVRLHQHPEGVLRAGIEADGRGARSPWCTCCPRRGRWRRSSAPRPRLRQTMRRCRGNEPIDDNARGLSWHPTSAVSASSSRSITW